jgi:MazG family protein
VEPAARAALSRAARPRTQSPVGERLPEALLELDAVTRRLRRDCPWDREQDEQTIVPHTVEEAYELADAAHSGDDRKLSDELGDVLFQVYFLSLLLEERGAGDLAGVARGITEKLIRRHPHVFGEDAEGMSALPTDARTASEVRENWDAIKRSEPGADPLGSIPENLPALLYAAKLQRRAEGSAVSAPRAHADVARALDETSGGDDRYERVGDLLFACVTLARALEVDPEIALRRAAERFRERVEASA